MPAQPFKVAMPPDVALWAGCIVRLRAISPTTGANVTGVKLTDASITVRNVGAGVLEDLTTGDWTLVPGPGSAL